MKVKLITLIMMIESEAVVNNSTIISPTNQDDNVIGGLNDTEFLFDFGSSNVGGNDVLSDQGNTAMIEYFLKIFLTTMPFGYQEILEIM